MEAPPVPAASQRDKADKSCRRPMGYWEPFNMWYRTQLTVSGVRPTQEDVARWYEGNAKQTWPGFDCPTLQETKLHSKCLRSLDQVRNYFRQYRAQKKGDSQDSQVTGKRSEMSYSAGGTFTMQTVSASDISLGETDAPYVPAPKARRPSADSVETAGCSFLSLGSGDMVASNNNSPAATSKMSGRTSVPEPSQQQPLSRSATPPHHLPAARSLSFQHPPAPQMGPSRLSQSSSGHVQQQASHMQSACQQQHAGSSASNAPTAHQQPNTKAPSTTSSSGPSRSSLTLVFGAGPGQPPLLHPSNSNPLPGAPSSWGPASERVRINVARQLPPRPCPNPPPTAATTSTHASHHLGAPGAATVLHGMAAGVPEGQRPGSGPISWDAQAYGMPPHHPHPHVHPPPPPYMTSFGSGPPYGYDHHPPAYLPPYGPPGPPPPHPAYGGAGHHHGPHGDPYAPYYHEPPMFSVFMEQTFGCGYPPHPAMPLPGPGYGPFYGDFPWPMPTNHGFGGKGPSQQPSQQVQQPPESAPRKEEVAEARFPAVPTSVPWLSASSPSPDDDEFGDFMETLLNQSDDFAEEPGAAASLDANCAGAAVDSLVVMSQPASCSTPQPPAGDDSCFAAAIDTPALIVGLAWTPVIAKDQTQCNTLSQPAAIKVESSGGPARHSTAAASGCTACAPVNCIQRGTSITGELRGLSMSCTDQEPVSSQARDQQQALAQEKAASSWQPDCQPSSLAGLPSCSPFLEAFIGGPDAYDATVEVRMPSAFKTLPSPLPAGLLIKEEPNLLLADAGVSLPDLRIGLDLEDECALFFNN